MEESPWKYSHRPRRAARRLAGARKRTVGASLADGQESCTTWLPRKVTFTPVRAAAMLPAAVAHEGCACWSIAVRLIGATHCSLPSPEVEALHHRARRECHVATTKLGRLQ